jgi:acyl carrier protein
MGATTYDEMLDATKRMLRRHVPETRAIEPSDAIQKDLGVDSLGVMELVADVESQLGIEVPNDVIDQLVTVDDVAKALLTLKNRP